MAARGHRARNALRHVGRILVLVGAPAGLACGARTTLSFDVEPSCADASPCSVAPANDSCAALACDRPPSVCYAPGTCANGTCSYSFANGAACDDADPCTEGDTCASGACIGKPVSCDVPPPPLCVSPFRLRSFSGSGTCSISGCTYAFSDETCAHACSAGACTASDIWIPLSTTNAPTARRFHTAVWTGKEMIVWGGQSANGPPLATGGRYNPMTNTWTAVSTAGAPGARYAHSAVWTGTEMIVWGGVGAKYYDDGGRYDPTTDTWTPVSSAGAPSGRLYQDGLWTGSEMIVWGGNALGYTSSGGRYVPARDTWSATSLTGAPSGRAFDAAVWTGSKMIVWGGVDSGVPGCLNTGGIYAPTSDTWSPTSMIGVPSIRYFHSGVWTGAEMIVWGGSDSSGAVLDTGGRYFAGSDAWSPTSTVGAPAPRSRHTAIWTGAEMIVWGGSFQSGGRYRPATDGWRDTTLVGAPTARFAHTAVWTGAEMIVWGGCEDLATCPDEAAMYVP